MWTPATLNSTIYTCMLLFRQSATHIRLDQKFISILHIWYLLGPFGIQNTSQLCYPGSPLNSPAVRRTFTKTLNVIYNFPCPNETELVNKHRTSTRQISKNFATKLSSVSTNRYRSTSVIWLAYYLTELFNQLGEKETKRKIDFETTRWTATKSQKK